MKVYFDDSRKAINSRLNFAVRFCKLKPKLREIYDVVLYRPPTETFLFFERYFLPEDYISLSGICESDLNECLGMYPYYKITSKKFAGYGYSDIDKENIRKAIDFHWLSRYSRIYDQYMHEQRSFLKSKQECKQECKKKAIALYKALHHIEPLPRWYLFELSIKNIEKDKRGKVTRAIQRQYRWLSLIEHASFMSKAKAKCKETKANVAAEKLFWASLSMKEESHA